jgi:hypothetical protein
MIQSGIMPVVVAPGPANAVATGQIVMKRGLVAPPVPVPPAPVAVAPPVLVPPAAVMRDLPPVVTGRA